MFNNQFRQRLDMLFADMERIKADPAISPPVFHAEIQELQKRLCELESQFLENEKRAAAQECESHATSKDIPQRPTAPLLYEKEHMGYSYSKDGVKSLKLLSPETNEGTDAVTAPLTASGQLIGEMQIKPPSERRVRLPE